MRRGLGKHVECGAERKGKHVCDGRAAFARPAGGKWWIMRRCRSHEDEVIDHTQSENVYIVRDLRPPKQKRRNCT